MNRDLVTSSEPAWAIQPYDERGLGQSAEAMPKLDLPTLLRIVFEWRWLIAAAVASGLALAAVSTMLTTPMYRAWVVLQVNPPTVQILDDVNGSEAQGQRAGDFVATQVGLLSSTSLAQRVTEDLNLASDDKFIAQDADPRARLREASQKVSDGLTVIPPEDGQLIKFSFESDSPGIAAQVANGVADAFIDSSLQRQYQASSYARNFLQRQLAKTRTELEASERDLVKYAQAEGIINTGTDQTASPVSSDANSPIGQSLSEINKALADATATRVAAEGAYRAALANGITSTENASSQSLRQARAGVEAQYQQKLTVMSPDHPEMVSLRSQISELDRQIALENSNTARARVATLRSDYEAAVSSERALQARVQQLKGGVLDLRGRSIKYAILQRDVDTNRALYDALLQRYKEIGVAGGIGTTPVSIVDRADPPVAPFKPNLVLNLLIGLALGLTAGVVAAIALDYLNDTIKNREDVRTKLGLACLGMVPKLPGASDFLEGLKDPGSPISEAYSTVAASLSFSTETGVPKVLMLTSARPSEGKSSSALALAYNYSRRGKSVLLIDCDLRKPAFKSPSQQSGLTKLLTNDESLVEHVAQTQFPNLWLLPSGAIPPNPADLLSTGRFRSLLREASAQFDMVIVDAPPVIGLADAPLIASMCKDAMFVIESGKTRTSVAREAVSKLHAAGAHVVGATLTKAVQTSSAYGYGYGYGYGDRKYGEIDRDRPQVALFADESEA